MLNLAVQMRTSYHIMKSFSHKSQKLFCSVTVPAGEWSAQSTTGEAPPPIFGHTFTKISPSKAALFGGDNGRHKVNDTYVLDMETWVWHAYGWTSKLGVNVVTSYYKEAKWICVK